MRAHDLKHKTSPAEFGEFLESLRMPGSPVLLCPRLLAKRLGLPLYKLALMLRVHRNSVASESKSYKVQERMGEVLRVISMISTQVRSVEQAIELFLFMGLLDRDSFSAAELFELGRGAEATESIRKMIEHKRWREEQDDARP